MPSACAACSQIRPRALMDESHKGEGDQGAEQAQHDDERQEFDVGSGSGLWVDHRSPPPVWDGQSHRTAHPKVIRQGMPEAVASGAPSDAADPTDIAFRRAG